MTTQGHADPLGRRGTHTLPQNSQLTLHRPIPVSGACFKLCKLSFVQSACLCADACVCVHVWACMRACVCVCVCEPMGEFLYRNISGNQLKLVIVDTKPNGK